MNIVNIVLLSIALFYLLQFFLLYLFYMLSLMDAFNYLFTKFLEINGIIIVIVWFIKWLFNQSTERTEYEYELVSYPTPATNASEQGINPLVEQTTSPTSGVGDVKKQGELVAVHIGNKGYFVERGSTEWHEKIRQQRELELDAINDGANELLRKQFSKTLGERE